MILSHWLGIGASLLSSCYGALISQTGGGDQRLLVHEASSYPQDFFTKRQLKIQQNGSICDAGVRQWSGHVPLGKGRNMFYCMPLTDFDTMSMLTQL
jgi:hypothetical protein